MAWDSLFIAGTKATTSKGWGGLFDDVSDEEIKRKQRQAQLENDAQVAAHETAYTNSFQGLAKNTTLDLGHKLVNVPVDFATSLYDSWKSVPEKIGKDISEGAKDINKSVAAITDHSKGTAAQGAGTLAKGVVKAGARTAGDAAIAVFAPVSAAIGAVLNATGGSKLLDSTGKVIADKSGITDIPAFQKFAMEHPLAGDDFDRLLNLAFAGAEKGKVDPKKIQLEAETFAEKVTKDPNARILPVEGDSVSTKVEFNNKYTPDAQLPTIELGAKPKSKSSLPTIQAEDTTRPSQSQSLKYEPIESKSGGFDTLFESEPVALEKPTVAAEASVEGTQSVANSRAQKLEAAAVERKLTDSLGELPTHDKMNMKAQAENAVSFIESRPEDAFAVAEGKALPPQGLLAESVYTALEAKAIREGDIVAMQRLAQSKVPTFAGQSLKALDSADPNSPVKILRDIQAALDTKVEKRAKVKAPEARKAEIKVIDGEIKKAASGRPTWEAFIDQLTCGY